MDSAKLKYLKVAEATIIPKFSPNVENYVTFLKPELENLTLDFLTDDSDATYVIKHGVCYLLPSILVKAKSIEKTIHVDTDSVLEIVIVVTAADKTTCKTYQVKARRLSKQTAILSNISLDKHALLPSFSSETYLYECFIPFDVTSISCEFTAPLPEILVKVGDNESKRQELAIGSLLSIVKIDVCSIDRSNTRTYSLIIRKPTVLWPVTLSHDNQRLIDPFTLQPYRRPVAVTAEVEDAIEADLMLKMHPSVIQSFFGKQLSPGDAPFENFDLASQAGAVKATTILPDGTILKSLPQVNICTKLHPSDLTKSLESLKACTAVNFPLQVKILLKNLDWQKRYSIEVSGENAAELFGDCVRELDVYLSLRAQIDEIALTRGAEIIKKLHRATCLMAKACEKATNNNEYALKLGLLLEEAFWLKQIYGLAHKERSTSANKAGYDRKALDSGLQDEISAICTQRGLRPNCSGAEQLQALDAEYKQLLAASQSAKADAVQALYVWKSRRVFEADQGTCLDVIYAQGTPINQAASKYEEAAGMKSRCFDSHLHLGFLLLMRGEYKAATDRLCTALSLQEDLPAANFALGIAQCSQLLASGTKDKAALSSATNRLQHGVVHFYSNLLSQTPDLYADPKVPPKQPKDGFDQLFARDFFRLTNPLAIRGLLLASEVMEKFESADRGCIPAEQILQMTVLYCLRGISKLGVVEGSVTEQLWTLAADGHGRLLQLVDQQLPATAKQRRFRAFVALCEATNKGNRLRTLHRSVCEKFLQEFPNDSIVLAQLGCALLNDAEADMKAATLDGKKVTPQAEELLFRATQMFQLAIKKEGTPAFGGQPEQQLANMLKQEEKPTASTAALKAKPTPKPAPAKPVVQAKVTAAGNKKSTAGKAPPIKTPAQTSSQPLLPPPPKDASVRVGPHGPKNTWSLVPRLGLARAFHLMGNHEQAADYYEQVIAKQPNERDLILDYASMYRDAGLAMRSVDVLCRVPESSQEFNDASIFGEIVDLLMKNEQYKDPRLETHMVKWAKIYGFGILESYVFKLEEKHELEVLRKVYCGVHNKSAEDPDVANYFKMKCWI